MALYMELLFFPDMAREENTQVLLIFFQFAVNSLLLPLHKPVGETVMINSAAEKTTMNIKINITFQFSYSYYSTMACKL